MTSHINVINANCDADSFSKDWDIGMINSHYEDDLEEEYPLMYDCLGPDKLDEWLDGICLEETDMDVRKLEDVLSSTKALTSNEATHKKRVKQYFSRRNSIPKRSVSPPPKRMHRMEEHQITARDAPLPQTDALSRPVVSPLAEMSNSLKSSTNPTGNELQIQYDKMVEKLALSMKRSEQSRAQIMKCQNSTVASSSICSKLSSPYRQSISTIGLAGFFSGKSTSLTAGLDQSRKQAWAYMNQMSANTI
uniref:Uncharacterized protein n=1 Tax=Ditylum brightwellii TaxID=49249 RepID=A0A7S4UTY3_9STRA